MSERTQHRQASNPSSAARPSGRGKTRGLFGSACLCALGLVAFLGSGTPIVGAAEFSPGQGFLPDNRAWEMVSPPQKNGADVAADTGRTRAAADGGAVGFISLGAFGDAIGTGVATDYVARRSSSADPGHNGWSTHAITPQNASISVEQLLGQLEPLYVGEYSPDLDAGVFFSHSPLTDDPDTANALNLYRRDDLLTPGPGSYDQVTACPGCETSGPLPVTPIGSNRPMLAGSSSDFEHVIFESEHLLTADTPAITDRVRLYEWSEEGGTRLAGRVPTGGAQECDDVGAPACAPAEVSLAGQGAGSPGSVATHVPFLTPHTVSDGSDGHSRIFFTVPTDGSGTTIVPNGSAGNLYMRLDGAKTTQLNASERDVPDGFAPASFWEATPDGTRVYFSSTEALTDDAPVHHERKLYMYDTTKPASEDNLTLMYTDEKPADLGELAGLIGTSTDGRYVYMVVRGQIVADGLQINNRFGIYLWHDGEVTFIGSLPNNGTLLSEQLSVGVNYLLANRGARATPNGRYVLFSSIQGTGLTGKDHGSCFSVGFGCREFYVYSADTDTLQCASCNPSGAAATVDAENKIRKVAGGTQTDFQHQTNVLSNEGHVFFTTAERLVSEDRNSVADAYVFNAATGKPRLLSSGDDPNPSYFLDASIDGKDAFFATRERLSGWDVDEAYDLYDARVEGGFPEPSPPPPSCQGDACQPAPVVLNDPTPSSSGFQGTGDPKANRGNARKPRCPQGKRRVKARGGKSRCVAKKKTKKTKRQTNGNRRAGK